MVDDEKAENLRAGGSPRIGRDVTPTYRLQKQARKRIGTHLRAMYDSVAQQPIPSRFTDLIAQLDDGPHEPSVQKP